MKVLGLACSPQGQCWDELVGLAAAFRNNQNTADPMVPLHASVVQQWAANDGFAILRLGLRRIDIQGGLADGFGDASVDHDGGMFVWVVLGTRGTGTAHGEIGGDPGRV